MSDFPTGTVTFLFTDLESSSRLWEEHPVAMQTALATHDAILKTAVQTHNGVLVKTTGDGVHAAFARPRDALEAALDIQVRISETDWEKTEPLTVRMGIHTGEAQFREGDYYGPELNRAARIMSLGHGGQTLLSYATYLLVSGAAETRFHFKDLGLHRLRGLADEVRLYQVSLPGLRAEFPPLDSGISVPHNLPESLNSFFGRTSELEALAGILADENVRLITLTGPGGTGKTRLSLEVARRVLDKFRDGVFFVQLAPIFDPELVPTTIARTIGLREGGGLPPLENLKTFLRDRTVLLILDNLEQVIESAGLLSDLLSRAPGLTILASSRIPLQVTGEQEFFLPPLDLPDPDSRLEVLENTESVQLFLDRARAIQPRFQLTPENALVIARICRRLDGLPLAIEIAAARIRMMPPAAILERLDDSLNLLTRVRRDLPDRQQTMRAAIDWSYRLLEPDARILFERLGVFAGGFTFDAAEAICDPEDTGDLFQTLDTLLSNSLIRTMSAEAGPRFDMLQTIRDFAWEKLSVREDFQMIRGRHARYYAHKTQGTLLDLFSARANQSLDWIEMDLDNLRAALNFGVSSPDHIDLAAQIASNIFWFWYRRGHFHEGYEWMLKIIRQLTPASPPAIAGNVLVTAGMMAMWVGELEKALHHSNLGLNLLKQAEEPWLVGLGMLSNGIIRINRGEDTEAHSLLEEAVYIFRSIGDRFFEATTMVHLANAALGLGKTSEARSWLDNARPIAQEVGDPWLIAFAANNLGEVARVERNFTLATTFYEETSRQFALADAKGDQARLVHTIGYMEMHAGNHAKAEAMLRESLSLFLELGNQRGITECLAALAGLSVRAGRIDWGAPLLAAAEALLASFGAAWWPADRVEIDAIKQLVRDAGVDMSKIHPHLSLQGAVEYALAGKPGDEHPMI